MAQTESDTTRAMVQDSENDQFRANGLTLPQIGTLAALTEPQGDVLHDFEVQKTIGRLTYDSVRRVTDVSDL